MFTLLVLPAIVCNGFVALWLACDAIAAKLRDRDENIAAEAYCEGFDHAYSLTMAEACDCPGCEADRNAARWN